MRYSMIATKAGDVFALRTDGKKIEFKLVDGQSTEGKNADNGLDEWTTWIPGSATASLVDEALINKVMS